jgi:predicted ArsR family transcriptional regulator
MSRYPHMPGHKGDGGTSRAAAEAYAPQVKGRRAQVLDGLKAGPATAEQIGERIGLHWYLTRPRLSELKAMGLVIETGAHGQGALGGVVSVWRLTTPAERQTWAEQAAMRDRGAA